MFESTFQLLSTHPLTLPAFVLALWVGYRLLRRSWFLVAALAKLAVVLALIPLFVTLFLAEYTGHWFWERLAEAIASAISSAAMGLVDLVDALFVAWLELVLVVSSGLWSGVQSTAASAAPSLSSLGFVLSVFAFQVVAGAAVVYAVYRASHEGTANGWLLAAGVVLFLAGLFAALIGLETWQLGRSTLASGLVAGMLGLTLGTTSMLVLVRPNFGGESMLPELKERVVGPKDPLPRESETEEVRR